MYQKELEKAVGLRNAVQLQPYYINTEWRKLVGKKLTLVQTGPLWATVKHRGVTHQVPMAGLVPDGKPLAIMCGSFNL